MKNPRKIVSCGGCGDDRPHSAFGLCQPCYVKEHRKRNPEAYLAASRRYTQKYKYGLENGQFEALLKAQGYQCAICTKDLTKPNTSFPDRACVDHNHTTGQVRGILCVACNTGIGHLQDNATLLRLAADYVEKCQS